MFRLNLIYRKKLHPIYGYLQSCSNDAYEVQKEDAHECAVQTIFNIHCIRLNLNSKYC